MTLQDPISKEDVAISNSTEMKEFLCVQNPTLLRGFKEQIEKERPDIEVVGCGDGVKIVRRVS